MTQTPQARQSRVSLFTFLGVLGLFTVVFMKMILPYLLALMMGGILALLASPFYKKVTRRLGPKSAAALVTFLVIVVVVGPMLSFAGLAIKQGITIAQWIAQSEGFSAQV